MYYLTDVRGSPVALVKPGASASVRAVVIERVSWSPYGVARHRPLGDIDGDGLVGFADLTIVLNLYEDSGATLGNVTASGGFERIEPQGIG